MRAGRAPLRPMCSRAGLACTGMGLSRDGKTQTGKPMMSGLGLGGGGAAPVSSHPSLQELPTTQAWEGTHGLAGAQRIRRKKSPRREGRG